MTCEQIREDLELFALGALASAEASAVAEHIASGCTSCQEALKRALDVNVMISQSAPIVDPPARLRRRIKESVAPSSAAPRPWAAWVLAAAALVALVVVFVAGNRLRRNDTEKAQAQAADRARMSRALQIIAAPGTREVSFSDPKVHDLHGALYIHQKLGLALLMDRLPTAPVGWKYESWVVPKSGAPKPVEPFQPDSGGRAVSVVPGPVDVDGTSAVAVSMEPLDARPTKPTTVVFSAKLAS